MGTFFQTVLQHYSSDCHVSHDHQSKGSLLTDESLIQTHVREFQVQKRHFDSLKGVPFCVFYVYMFPYTKSTSNRLHLSPGDAANLTFLYYWLTF